MIETNGQRLRLAIENLATMAASQGGSGHRKISQRLHGSNTNSKTLGARPMLIR